MIILLWILYILSFFIVSRLLFLYFKEDDIDEGKMLLISIFLGIGWPLFLAIYLFFILIYIIALGIYNTLNQGIFKYIDQFYYKYLKKYI